MRRPRCCGGARVVILAAALAAMSAAAPAAGTLPSPKDEWVEVRGPGVTVTTNVKPRKAVELAEAFDRFHAALRLLQPGLRHDSPVPVHVMAFDDDASYRPYREVLGPGGEGVVGHFFGGPFGSYLMFVAYPRRGDAKPILYHEYVHSFLSNNFGVLPLWLNEGLAEYFSTLTEEGDQVVLGMPVEHHIELLRRRSFVPLERLFAIDQSSPEYRESERKGVFYAESWALVHYLLTEPARGARVSRLLDELERGADADTAFRASLGTGVQSVEEELRGYLNSRTFPILRMPADSLGATATFEARALSREAAIYRLGTYLALAGSPGAPEHLEAVGEAVPDAWASLAAYEAANGDDERAHALFERAAAEGASEALSHILHADFLLRRVDEGRPDPATLERVRASLGRALAADPGFAEARALLGKAYTRDPQTPPEEAIPHLKGALEALPGRVDLAFELAQLQVLAGDVDAAERLSAEVIAPADPALAEQLARRIEGASATDSVNRAIESGSTAEVRAALVEALATSSDPALRAQMDERLAEIELQLEAEQLTDRYNRAILSANTGQLTSAERALEEIEADLAALRGGDAEIPLEIDRHLRSLERAVSGTLSQIRQQRR